MNIEFSCANCGANLKVLKAFAGKTIQCPKCTKKTPVPGAQELPPPVAAKSASAPAAFGEPKTDGLYVSFSCANCASSLKVLKSFSGKLIQCPKCTKKTPVPDLAAKSESAPAEPAVPAPAAETPKPVSEETAPAAASVPKIDIPDAPPAVAKPPAAKPVAPTPKPEAAAPSRPSEDLRPLLDGQEKKLEAMMRQMKDMELRLDVARLRAEKAEQEKQSLAVRKEQDRAKLQDELSAHFKAEIEAARRTIGRLEENVRDATRQRIVKASSIDGRTAAQIEKELLENPDDALTEAETAVPDAVMADIRQSRFSRYVRASLLIHAVLLAVTSVGVITAYFWPPPEGEEGAGTNTVTAVSAPVSAEETAPVAAATNATAPDSPAPAVKPDAAAVVPPATVKPIVPETEALPEPGEKPPSDTSVKIVD